MQPFQNKIKLCLSLRAQRGNLLTFIFSFFFLLFAISFTKVSADICGFPGLACNTGGDPYTNPPESDCPIGQKCVIVDLGGGIEDRECILCNSTPTCLPQGVLCTPTDSCCVGLCQNSQCSCKPNNTSCSLDNECCGNLCKNGTCTEIGFECRVTNYGNCLPTPNCTSPQISDGQIDCQDNYVCCRDLSLYDTLIFCSTSTKDNKIINTAIGCIPSEVNAFTNGLMLWSLGVGGGISFLVIVWGSILIITNGHDPKKIQAGQEMIVAAISGTIMIVISVLLVNYLGAKVLSLGPIGFLQ